MRRGTIRGVALLGLAVVLVQAAVAIPAGAADIPPGLEWSGRSPVLITYGDNVDSRWDSFLRGGANDWGRSNAVNTRVIGGQGGAALCDPRNDRAPRRSTAEVCNGRYGATGWLGLTYVYRVQGTKRIVGARVFMNDSYFQTMEYDDPRAKRHTMTHELGHALGLSHANGASVMNDSGNSILRYDEPTGADYKRLRSKYQDNRSANTADAAAAEGNAPVTAKDIGGGIELIIVEVLAD